MKVLGLSYIGAFEGFAEDGRVSRRAPEIISRDWRDAVASYLPRSALAIVASCMLDVPS